MAIERSAFIAVVDDELSVRKAILRLFRSYGLEARGFSSGAEFLETLPFCHYDCIVLDLHMPGLSGLDVQLDTEFLKADIPTVIITAVEDTKMNLKCLSAGAAFYLRKPFDDDVLLRAVLNATNG